MSPELIASLVIVFLAVVGSILSLLVTSDRSGDVDGKSAGDSQNGIGVEQDELTWDWRYHLVAQPDNYWY